MSITYDPERAKELLAEAGAEDLELTLTIPSFYGTTVPQVLVSDFNDVGVTLDRRIRRVRHLAAGRLHEQGLRPELRAARRAARLRQLRRTPSTTSSTTTPRCRRCTPRRWRPSNPDESAELLAQAARLVSEDHAADWLYNGATITAVGAGVSGFPVDSINSRINLAEVTVSR